LGINARQNSSDDNWDECKHGLMKRRWQDCLSYILHYTGYDDSSCVPQLDKAEAISQTRESSINLSDRVCHAQSAWTAQTGEWKVRLC
jgi:hypothetical protein